MASPLPPICILAGGLATRLGGRVAETPKALIEVAGEPFIDHQLRLLARHGAREVVLCVGYLGERIVEHAGSERFAYQRATMREWVRLHRIGLARRATLERHH